MKCIRPFCRGESVVTNDGQMHYVTMEYPCGKCLACRINKTRQWTMRLLNEEVYAKTAFFITLTYDDEHLPHGENGFQSVSKSDVQLFLKRLRKKYQVYGKDYPIRYFINSEYGPETLRPHYHGIFFNVSSDIWNDAIKIVRGRIISFHSPSLEKIWQNGNVEFGECRKERCGYCSKYFVNRLDVPEGFVPNFTLMSRNPGIGYRYSQDIQDKVVHDDLTSMLSPSGGKPVALPRYYRDKIYMEDGKAYLHEKLLRSMVGVKREELSEHDRLFIEEQRLRSRKHFAPKSKL